MDQPYPLDSSDQLQHLVSVDLQQYRGDADKLYSISVNLQTLSREQRARLDKLQENRPPSLHNSNSTSTSRRPTDELQKNNPIINDNEEGTVIVFNPSDNNLEIRQKNSMKGADYIVAELPSYHWWSDRLHIYYEKRINSNSTSSSEYGRPRVVIEKRLLPGNSQRDVTFHRSIRLGDLGWGIRARRILGQIKVIYVESPTAQPRRTEMTRANFRNP